MAPDDPTVNNSADRELEAALARLRPMPASLQACNIAMQAGIERGRRRLRSYRIAVALLAAALGASLVPRSRPPVAPSEKIVYVKILSSPNPAAPRAAINTPPVATDGATWAAYLDFRQSVIDEGLAALTPLPASHSRRPQTIITASQTELDTTGEGL